MAPILIHSDSVPAAARRALVAASALAPESRRELLESAARSLHHDAAVDCHDALELVGLSPDDTQACAE